MQIALHIGAHCTDEDRLLKCLLMNKEILSDVGTAVPGPGRYRRLLRETIQTLNGAAPAPDAREVLLDAIVEEDDVDRIIISHESFICVPARIFDGGQLYSQLEFKLSGLRSLFPQDQIEIFLGIRNPATLIADMLGKLEPEQRGSLLGGIDPASIRWSDMIARVQAVLPNAKITAWSNEESPLLWGEIMRKMGGLEPHDPLVETDYMLSKIMLREGTRRFRAFIADNPPKSEAHLRRNMVAFLDKYARAELIDIEQPVELAHWNEAYVQHLTDAYEADITVIEQMQGIDFIAP
ncbi:hypothetical protein [Nereida ignava]|uniref:hypothetical protein n=1 Tax=Nereida ignava TaxID=282199 RepID=UPI003F6AA848